LLSYFVNFFGANAQKVTSTKMKYNFLPSNELLDILKADISKDQTMLREVISAQTQAS